MNRGGQLKISFGMIFSIILIVMFLAFGFYAISGFLGLQESVQTEKFIDGFQENVDTMWSSQVYGTKDLKFSLPSSVEKICFVNEVKNLEIWDPRVDGDPSKQSNLKGSHWTLVRWLANSAKQKYR